MATKISELREEIARLERKVTLGETALALVLSGTLEARETVAEAPGVRHVLSLYGSTRADGGIVVSRFVCSGQRDHYGAGYLEEGLRIDPSTPLGWSFRGAYERLAVARQKMLDAETVGAS